MKPIPVTPKTIPEEEVLAMDAEGDFEVGYLAFIDGDIVCFNRSSYPLKRITHYLPISHIQQLFK